MKISIITPNYNYAEYIDKTIESVINQNYPDWEHIIVDDGSTDDSVEVISKYILPDSVNIRLIKKENEGQSSAINEALKVVTGDIIGWINSDDYFCETIFNEIASIFEKKPLIDAVFGNFNVVDVHGVYIYSKRHFKFSALESAFIGCGNTLTSNCIFWRKTLSDRTGPLDVNLKSNMDGEYLSRLTINANLFFLDKTIANFRKQPVSIAGRNVPNWNKVIIREMTYEKEQSYQRLKISKFIPYNLGKHFNIFFLMVRFVKKVLRFDYFLIYLNKKRYYRNL